MPGRVQSVKPVIPAGPPKSAGPAGVAPPRRSPAAPAAWTGFSVALAFQSPQPLLQALLPQFQVLQLDGLVVQVRLHAFGAAFDLGRRLLQRRDDVAEGALALLDLGRLRRDDRA